MIYHQLSLAAKGLAVQKMLKWSYFDYTSHHCDLVLEDRKAIFLHDTLAHDNASLLGGSGRVVNSLDFCPASFKSLGCFYFRCVLSSQWKAWQWIWEFYTANFKGIACCSCNRMPPNAFFPQTCKPISQKTTQTLFSTLHPLSPVIFATASVVAFVLLRNSRFNFRCYTQHEATPTQKSAQKWRCDLSRLLARKITKGIYSCKPPYRTAQ